MPKILETPGDSYPGESSTPRQNFSKRLSPPSFRTSWSENCARKQYRDSRSPGAQPRGLSECPPSRKRKYISRIRDAQGPDKRQKNAAYYPPRKTPKKKAAAVVPRAEDKNEKTRGGPGHSSRIRICAPRSFPSLHATAAAAGHLHIAASAALSSRGPLNSRSRTWFFFAPGGGRKERATPSGRASPTPARS